MSTARSFGVLAVVCVGVLPAFAQECIYPVAIERVSLTSLGGETFVSSCDTSMCSPCKNNTHASISADGDRIVFSSDADPLTPHTLPGPPAPARQIYVRIVSTGTTLLVSTPSYSTPGLPTLGVGCSDFPDISRDGAFVAFESTANNLTPSPSFGDADVYVHKLAALSTERVSENANGVGFNGTSNGARLSGDGSIVVFKTTATDPVLTQRFGNVGGVLGAENVIAVDRNSGAIEWISAPQAGSPNGASLYAAINADGRYVAFSSTCSVLYGSPVQTPDPNGVVQDVFVRDRASGALIPISVSPSGAVDGNDFSRRPAISDSGRYVAFESQATNLTSDLISPVKINVFVRDRDSDENGTFDDPGGSATILMSVTEFGDSAPDNCGYLAISGDGRFVVFTCRSDEFHNCDGGVTRNQFVVHDRDTDGNGVFDENGGTHTAIASKTPLGVYANGLSGGNCGLSATGKYAAFNCEADNLVSGDTNAFNGYGRDVFRVQFLP